MLNVALYSTGIFESCGVPNYFLKEQDFNLIVKDETARRSLIAQLGEGVCVGLLGTKTPQGYVEEEQQAVIPSDDERKGDMGYYEKL